MDKLREELSRNGFVRIPKSVFCLTDNQITNCRNALKDLFDGNYETGIYPDEIHWRKGISKDNVTREICNGWKANQSTIARIVCSKELGELASHLMGWETTTTRLAQDDVLHKPPGSGPVGWHTDGAYISDNFVPRNDNCLTMWMALDTADAENGALQYAPGSHLWKKKDRKQKNNQTPDDDRASDDNDNNHKNDNDVGDNDNPPVGADVSNQTFHVVEGQDHTTSLRQAAIEAGMDPSIAVEQVVTVPVNVGEMVVHHQDIWHGSCPNISQTRHRRALVAHILRGDVQWREQPIPHYIYGRYYIQGEKHPRPDFFPLSLHTMLDG